MYMKNNIMFMNTIITKKLFTHKLCKAHYQVFSMKKKVMSDSSGLVDFSIRLVNSVLYFPKGQVKIFGELQLQKYCKTNVLNS